MNERDASAKTIFLEAIEQPAADRRAAFLDAACGGDSTLRDRVQELLRAHEEAGNFLGSAAALPLLSGDGADVPGETIGTYRLVQEIGEGGFGIVYLAEQQQPLRRRVALKVLKPGMDTRQVIARFEAERQALALMDHPNIARVHDAGQTPAGRPYFVMEFVDGVPITRYCDEHHLTPRERLELFLPVCQAVQHAHQKGIIHRDLKPSNVVVTVYDDRPVPKVIDFGVAKAIAQPLTEQTLVTGFGSIVGTLEYMSPEQAELHTADIDTRADIYSLGVLLYELLTGSTPITREHQKQAPLIELLRLIREEEPPTPSTRISESRDTLTTISTLRRLDPAQLAREVRGDLDWIVMRCLEKDRTRRYQTANSLAGDIEHYLHDEPVEASPPSRWYRARKFSRRHRGLISTALGFVLLLAVGAGVSTWQALRALTAERVALSARDNAAEQLKQAKRSEKRAQAVLKFFQDKVLSAARPKGQEGGLSPDATIREALDHAEPEIASSFAGEPLVEASIRNTLGVSYWYLGDQKNAIKQQEHALAIRRRELGPDNPETVGALNDLAIALERTGKVAEAQKLLEEVVAVKRRALGRENPNTLRSVNNLAVFLAMQGQLEDAVKLAEETLEIQRRVDGPESITTLRSEYNVAIMRRHLGRWAEARPLFDDSLRTLRRVFGPNHQDTLRVVNALGELLLDQRRPAEARALFEQALEGQRRVLGPTRDETILTMINLADAARLQGRLEEARTLAAEADTLNRRTFGPEHPQTLFGLTILSSIVRDQGHFAEARDGYEKALTAFRRTLSPRVPEVQRCMADYAWMLASASDPACRDPQRAIALANEVIQNSPKVRDIWTTLGAAHYRSGAWNDAIAALEKSEASVPGPFTAINGLFLAMAYGQRGEKNEGRKWYAEAVSSVEKASQPTRRELALFRWEAAHLLDISDPKQPSSEKE